MEEIRILVIEDEKPIADILEYGFKKEGFRVKSAYTGADGLSGAEEFEPNLVLLDWMLPDLSGVDVCKMLTEMYNIPIIMLTARGSIDDKVYGLESGADDYITKPFDLREVIVRVKTILRRFGKSLKGQEEQEIRVENAVISERERTVCQDGEYVELTPKEFDLLVWMVKNPRRVFTRSHLLDEIWGYDFMGDTRTVDIHIQRLRKKLCMGESIVTVFGVGYKYVPKE
ncbi:MAG: response regulator transcription factor [Dorea sp.]|nr:response regulator transcription factor [Dorea sp.]